MLVAVKTRRIELQMKGDIPERVLLFLEEEYGVSLRPTTDDGEEAVNALETDWYKRTMAAMPPGKALRIYRENAGLTQTALGDRMGGVPRQHISNMENGKRPIGKENAKRLATALHTDYRMFL
ncbi:MAG: helix-turn-helix transcriptional regulator [Desulfobulbus sp.]|jgi:antitoxin component HigA of HigAB toxin-antitoxin module|nr:helix-turn-helix transcriptional regulator [Desulfobulbus sp.]